jgi:cytochrome b involved in lipid metabolism
MSRIFTWEEILNSHENLIVANKNVYEISELFDIHPGGKNCLIKHLYQDCTIDYNFHSRYGKLNWKKYKIGVLKEKNSCIIL